MKTNGSYFSKRFLGCEFLTWLWFASEERGGKAGEVEFSVLGPLKLVSGHGDAREITIKGSDPTASPEAIKALARGKVLRKATVRLLSGGQTYEASLSGDTLAFGGVGVSVPARLPLEDRVMKRLQDLAGFHATLGALYAHFIELRFDAARWAGEMDAMRDWLEREAA